MLPVINEITRTEAGMHELSLGVKCGGSDGFSGLSANPALGRAADLLVANDVAEAGSGFGTDTNRVSILGADGSRDDLIETAGKIGD